jgi:hypothetical protein
MLIQLPEPPKDAAAEYCLCNPPLPKVRYRRKESCVILNGRDAQCFPDEHAQLLNSVASNLQEYDPLLLLPE